MPIDSFRRSEKYFNTKIKIRSADVDRQFNDIVNFLNNKILPVINNLIYEQFLGSDNPALQNAFLVNVGDGTSVKWDFIKLDNFEYNGLSLIKIEPPIDNSVLATDNNSDYVYTTPMENNQVLQSVLNDTPIWQLITNDCFEDRSVLGKHITLRSITADNLRDAALFLLDNSIPNVKFKQNCVTTNNLTDGGIGTGLTFDRLKLQIQAGFPTMITSNMLPDNYFDDFFDVIFSEANAYGNDTAPEYIRITNLTNIKYSTDKFANITAANVQNYTLDNLALNSINGNRLQYYNNDVAMYYPYVNDLIENGAVYPEHLTAELRALLDL